MKKELFSLLILLLSSCISINNKEDIIDLEARDKTSIWEFVDTVRTIQLETNNQSLISVINKVIKYDSNYYIFDKKLQTLFCFNEKGKFLFKISQKGQGPNEYTYIEDFNIDSYNNEILTLVPFGELLSFDLKGHFVKKTKLPNEVVAYNEIYPINKDILLFVSMGASQILYYSRSKNKIIKRIYQSDRQPNSPFHPLGKTYTYRDSVYFSPVLSNCIINLSREEQNEHFTWNFGPKNNSHKNIQEMKNYIFHNQERLYLQDIVGSNKFINYYILRNYETERYIISIIDRGTGFANLFYDKLSHRSFIFDKTIEGIRFIFPDFYENEIIMYDKGIKESPIDLTFYNLEIMNKESSEIIKQHNPETDNPFLVIYSIKKE